MYLWCVQDLVVYLLLDAHTFEDTITQSYLNNCIDATYVLPLDERRLFFVELRGLPLDSSFIAASSLS